MKSVTEIIEHSFQLQMNRTIVAFLGFLLLAGCSLFESPDYNKPYPDEGLKQAEGRHIDKLVDKMGFPDHVGRVGSYDVYTWTYDGGEVTTTDPGIGNIGPTFYTTTRWCEIKVSVNANGIVGKWQWDGNRCGRFGKKLNQ